MYSGITLTKYSGRVFGSHQKIDRAARDNLSTLLGEANAFPSARQILQFEGLNGPDGIKRKSPSRNEPWHFIDPADDSDVELLGILGNHYRALVQALKAHDEVRAAFEAAWLAHAVVDGLTPAHHYPFEEKLAELRGEDRHTRTSIKSKWIMPGTNRRNQLANNWKVWGASGLFTTHTLFEMGLTTIISAMRLRRTVPSWPAILDMQKLPFDEWFGKQVQDVVKLNLYERFYKRGWTAKLARDVRRELVPLVTRAVTLTWYRAAIDAGLTH